MEPYEVTVALQREPFYVACDGSATPRYAGSFGWVICDKQKQRVARASGPVRGYCLTSYRAEATGMLSVSRFLLRLAEYTALSPSTWHTTYVCDNNALASVVNKMLTFIRRVCPVEQAEDLPMPLNPLIPDWDILSELYCTICTWEHLLVVHVKGHQDSNLAYAKLSLPAQLNVDADKLASAYHDFDPDPKPWAHVMPHTGAHLHCNQQGTVTYRYAQLIRSAESTDPSSDQASSSSHWVGGPDNGNDQLGSTLQGVSTTPRQTPRPHY